ncbi:MAG: DUF1588 domain-containing protein [Nannocystaceae bacterium]|nr:DUF1588 domain-containing protein [Nannocystaceae bacterium]
MKVRSIALSLVLLTGCYSGGGQLDPSGGADGTDGDGADGGADGDADGGEDDSAGEGSDDDDGGWAVGTTPMRRLTRAQFVQSVRDLLAIPQWVPQTDLPDEGVNEEEFQLPNMVASTVTTTPVGYNRYRIAAKEASALAFATDEAMVARLGCSPTGPQDACVVDYLVVASERAFSRAISQDDPVLLALQDVVVDATERLGSVRLGLQWAMTSLLQSPEFLYFYPVDDGAGGIDAYSKARSLALMFRDSIPDDALLAHARDGSLDDPELLDLEIDRLIAEMIDDPTQRGAVQRFFDEWWSMTVVEAVGKDPDAFPEFDDALRTAMKQELELWLQDILFERDLDFRSVLVSDRMFVNNDLAALYGIAGEFDDELVAVELSADSPRSGLLSSAAFLSVMSHPALTSPAARGRFVTERLLCLSIPPPPASVDTTVPPPEKAETKRDRFSRHTTDPTCAACHQMMDPMGLSLEEFDAIGRFRREETVFFEGESYELPLDTTGELNGVAFADSKEMAVAVSEDPGFARCVTHQLLRHTLGRALSPGEATAVNELEQGFVDGDMSFVDLMREVARHRITNSFTEAE